ncbi:MAG TPA: hypothetical protein VK589_22925, partial [Chryseolinea sp.]|nr:hypothetical protein [Chryseolinea sp.]
MSRYRPMKSLLLIVLITNLRIPAFSQEESVSRSSESSVSHSSNGVHRWKNTSGLTNFNIESRGKIEVTDDDRDIKSISNDGYLEITKTVFGSKRAIIIESLGGGKIKKEYYEGRTKMEWDPHGKNWLAEILPEIVRSTTLGAEGRVNRIYAKDGVPGVVAELSRLDGDYTASHYAKLLLEKNIPASELPRAIAGIADAIDSDYYLSTVLQSNVTRMLSTPDAANAFLEGTKKIGSAYYKAVVLKEAAKKLAGSPAQVKTILHSAAEIDSDYYLAVVLNELLERSELKEESVKELIVVSKNIPSDYYRTQVLNKAINRSGLSNEALKNAVSALEDINSDYYKSTVFNNMAERTTLGTDVQVQMLNQIKESLHSDYYASGVLKNILEHQDVSDESFKLLVSIGGNFSSANYAADVLKAAAEKDLNKNKLIDILNASANIHSDHYLSEVLLR